MDHMKPLKSFISVEEAHAVLRTLFRPVERREAVDLLRAAGRVLAVDVVAPCDVPPFARAAMDGYAVQAADTYGAGNMKPAVLEVAGTVHAGEVPASPVSKGKAMQTATGAPMPDGADAVVMVEDTEAESGRVKIYKPVHPAENVTRAGSDILKGVTVLRAGAPLDPAKVGVLAALGMREAEVYARPRVAVVPTGNEVWPPGTTLPAGKIYDVNSYTMAALVDGCGCEAVLFPVVEDTSGALESALFRAAECDAVVVTGGSSVGERDHMAGAVERLGEVKFHGVAVKPGKPTLAGVIKSQKAEAAVNPKSKIQNPKSEVPLIGMPGYPTSCLTNGYGLLLVVLRAMARLPPAEPRVVTVPLARRTTSAIGRHQYLPVKLVDGEAVPVFKESGAITSMADADGYIEIPAAVDLVEKGETVRVHLF